MNFKHIYIIESLDKKIWTTPFLAQGTCLFDTLNAQIKSVRKEDTLFCHYVDIQSKDNWQMLWKTLKANCKKGEFPLLHFMCHGSPQGLTISGYRKLRWFDFIQRLSSITKYYPSLFVTMNVCYSADSRNIVENLSSMPFNGCICCKSLVKLKRVDRDKTRFRSFYNALINGETVDCAIEAFREELRNENVDVTPWVVGAYDNVTKCVKFIDLEKWIANSI